MFNAVRREWRLFRQSPPGKRFQRRYRRVRERRARAHEGREDESTRILRLAIAFVLLAVGICLILFPLVYIPFLAAGTALFASESLGCARLLDQGGVGSAARLGLVQGQDRTSAPVGRW